MDNPIGKQIKELENLGVILLNEEPKVLTISVPKLASNGMTGAELANHVSEVFNKYITNGKLTSGVVTINYTIREGGEADATI
jgi:hypothetical protein